MEGGGRRRRERERGGERKVWIGRGGERGVGEREKAPCISNKKRNSSGALFEALLGIDYVQDQSEASHV